MIDLHYWPTPNGKKVSIFLEETGTPYRLVPVNIGRGDQFKPDYLKLNPNHRMGLSCLREDDGPGAKDCERDQESEQIGNHRPKELRGGNARDAADDEDQHGSLALGFPF